MDLQKVQPLVSIITPVYNHASFIRTCIDSVLSQTNTSWEQIIIDDGSTDSTGKIISEYSDPRIRYEYQNNRGPFELACSYNRALSLAKGDLIAILEGDDFWPSNKLAILVPAFENREVVLAYGEAVDVDSSGSEQSRPSWMTRLRKGLPPSILCNDPIGRATLHMLSAEGRSLVSPSTVIIRRSALDRIGGFQYESGLPLTDYPTFIKLSLEGKFHYSPETLGYRRRHGSSITVNHAQTIHTMVSKFTLSFLDTHKDRLPLSPMDRQELESNWRQAEDKLHFGEGRFLLLQKKWAEARSHFYSAAKSKQFTVRTAARIGLLFSWLHVDIELFMRLAGRAELGAGPMGPELTA